MMNNTTRAAKLSVQAVATLPTPSHRLHKESTAETASASPSEDSLSASFSSTFRLLGQPFSGV